MTKSIRRGRRRRASDARKLASAHSLARIIGLALPPLAHEFFKLGIAAFRQHDARGGKEIAGPLLGGKAFAFESECASRTCPRRNGEFNRAGERRHPHLAA